MEWWQLGLLTLAGSVAGFLNVMAGGGSLLTVPILLFMGLPGPVANGTNRIAILAQNITAVTAFRRRGFSDFRLSISLSLAAIPGAIAGAMIGVRLDGVWFERTLALIMLAVMLIMWRSSGKKSSGNVEITRSRLILGHVCMVGAGFWGGFIQIGVGFILMPILSRVMGLDLVRVNMHKVFIVLSYTLVALTLYASQVEIFWMAGLCLAIGNSIGAWVATHLSISRGEKLINRVLNLVLIAFIIKLLFF